MLIVIVHLPSPGLPFVCGSRCSGKVAIYEQGDGLITGAVGRVSALIGADQHAKFLRRSQKTDRVVQSVGTFVSEDFTRPSLLAYAPATTGGRPQPRRLHGPINRFRQKRGQPS